MPVELLFRDARRSQTDLQRLTAQVVGDIEFWRSRGIEKVMTPDADKTHHALHSRYGDRVAVRDGEWTRGPYTPDDPGER